MGAFNILKCQTACPACGQMSTFEIQFKYGDTWQYQYAKGESLKWGGNDIGKPNCKNVRVEGVGGPCAFCKTEFIEFDISLENDVIVDVVGIGKERKCQTLQGYEIIEDV